MICQKIIRVFRKKHFNLPATPRFVYDKLQEIYFICHLVEILEDSCALQLGFY